MRDLLRRHVGCILGLLLLALSITGCGADVQGWIDAKTSNEEARAAAEWARTEQTQAESDAAVREAPARAQAKTVALVGAVVVGVLTLAGLGAAAVAWAWRRAQLVYTDKAGLYPVVIGASPVTNLNEPGAQQARIAPHRSPYQVLPPEEADAIPVIPAPIALDARQLQHIERLLLPAPGSTQHDTE